MLFVCAGRVDMARFFADEIDGDTARFLEDAQHMARILRLKPGDAVTVMDGRGMESQGIILAVDRDAVTARLSSWKIAGGESSIRITVYQGLCKGDRFETMVQKCTELGVSTIVPLRLSHCEVKPQDMNKRIPRLQKIAREAAKQSGRGLVPEILNTTELSNIDFHAHDLMLCPYEAAREHGLRAVFQQHCDAKAIGIIIGPEGGLELSEADYCCEHGACIITLGPRILRTETAAPAVVAALMAMSGQWDGEKD